MRYVKRFIRIPQKVVNNYRQKKTDDYETYSLCLLTSGVIFNFNICLKLDKLLYKL